MCSLLAFSSESQAATPSETCPYRESDRSHEDITLSGKLCRAENCSVCQFFSQYGTIQSSAVLTSTNKNARLQALLALGPLLVELDYMEEFAVAVQDSPVKELGTVYEQIFVEHHQENPIEYTLSPSAKETFLKYCKGTSAARRAVQSSQGGAGTFHPECNAKSTKNALGLSLNIHILWHRLDKALQQLTGPKPKMITEATISMALALHDALLSFGGVAEVVRFSLFLIIVINFKAVHTHS